MTSSPDATRDRGRCRCRRRSPSMWRLCKLGYRHEPRLDAGGVRRWRCSSALPDALLALWLKLLGEGVHRAATGRSCASRRSALGALRHGHVVPADRQHPRPATVPRQGDDRARSARRALQASIATIAHQERPDYLDRLSVLRNQVFVLDHMYMSLFSTCGWILRLGVTIVLLVVDPPGAGAAGRLRAADGAHVHVAAGRGTRRLRARRPGRAAGAAPLHIATTAPPGKEVRVTGIGERLMRARRAAWERRQRADRGRAVGFGRVAHRWPGRCSARPTWARSCSCRPAWARRPATCCWCWRQARGCRRTSAPRSARSASCAASGWTAAQRLAWLEDYAASLVASGGSARARPVCRRARHPLRARVVRLSRHHAPGARRREPDLPAGTVVAIVGENGAGKIHARQAAGQDVRADERADPGRWNRPGADCRRRRMARAAGGRVPGLLPVRVPGPAHRGRRRRAAAGRRARRGLGGRHGRAPTTWWPS